MGGDSKDLTARLIERECCECHEQTQLMNLAACGHHGGSQDGDQIGNVAGAQGLCEGSVTPVRT